MADEANSGVYDTTHPVTMFFPNLDKPRAFKGKNGKDNGEPKYSANFGMAADHPDLLPMKRVALAVAKAQWPGRDIKTLAFPFLNGSDRADKAKARGKNSEHERNLVVMPARSKFEPRLSAIVNRQIVEYDDEAARAKAKDKFFNGAEVLVQVNFVAYEGVGQNPDGVTAYLNQVLATGKGKRIAGSQGVSETFRSYAGAMSAEDPTRAATDDEIPF